MYSALPNARRSDLAPQPSTGYHPTHWQTGLLASNFTTRSAASIRRRRHLREELESSLREDQLIATNNSSSRPDLKRIGSRTPSAVRFGMRRTSQTTMHSPLSHIPTKLSLPGLNNNQKNLNKRRNRPRNRTSPRVNCPCPYGGCSFGSADRGESAYTFPPPYHKH